MALSKSLTSFKKKRQSMKSKVERGQNQNLKLGQYPPQGTLQIQMILFHTYPSYLQL